MLEQGRTLDVMAASGRRVAVDASATISRGCFGVIADVRSSRRWTIWET